jgi:hypothetical protein
VFLVGHCVDVVLGARDGWREHSDGRLVWDGRQWEQTMQRAIGGSVGATTNPARRREGLGAACGLNGKVKVGLQGSWIGNRDG